MKKNKILARTSGRSRGRLFASQQFVLMCVSFVVTVWVLAGYNLWTAGWSVLNILLPLGALA